MPFTDSLRFVEVLRVDSAQLTATPSDVANGKIYIGTTKKLESGTLPVLEEHGDITLVAGESHTVEYGKVPKAYTIYSTGLADQTDGTATAEDIKTPETAWVNGTKIIGTMPDNGAQKEELAAGQSVGIKLGYHNGAGIVTAKDLESQTQGNATADDIVSGKTAWVNGIQLSGALPEILSQNITLGAGEEYQIPYGKHSGNGTITVVGLDNETPGTATADDIAMDKTAWVNGVQITGNLPKIAAQTITLPFNGEYIIPAGIHSGLGKITQEVEVIEDQIVIAPAFHDQTISTAGKYLAQDIYVPGIDALNYEFITSGEYLINDPDTGNSLDNDITKVYRLPVDNWHDNATLNVYQYELNSTFGVLSGILYCNFLNGQTEFTIDGGMFDLKIDLESGTNAHQITLNLHSGHDVGGLFNLRELYHARRYGDDHDVD